MSKAAEIAITAKAQALVEALRAGLRRTLPRVLYRPVTTAVRRSARPVRWGNLRRLAPVDWPFARGLPVDRHYIERFLERHASDIRGRVLEVADDDYTLRFGGSHVTRSDVLHMVPGNPRATLVGDLATGIGIPRDAFDCVILTQTLPFIYDLSNAVAHVRDALSPGGVLLATAPGISQISAYDMERWGDYWRFTTLSARRLFEQAFPAQDVAVTTYGNVLAAVAFLHGIASDELTREELEFDDPGYQVLISIRAVRPRASGSLAPAD